MVKPVAMTVVMLLKPAVTKARQEKQNKSKRESSRLLLARYITAKATNVSLNLCLCWLARQLGSTEFKQQSERNLFR